MKFQKTVAIIFFNFTIHKILINRYLLVNRKLKRIYERNNRIKI
jgi:hypothetical protein